jgi:NAD(P)-dependent dehydrogenase (short-subunit alcohol dehydrogenase family)
MTRYLQGKHAVVTGGGRGIGAAIAGELARLGASVTLMGRDVASLEARADELRKNNGASVAAVTCDVSNPIEVNASFARARERFGDPRVLVNNAGQAEAALFTETTLELWERILRVNLTGAFLCTGQVLPAMIAARDGRVVNIASTAGLRGYARMSAYSASKHGLLGLTKSLAQETAKHGVTVNAVCPGYTSDTSMVRQAMDNVMAARNVSADEALKMVTRLNPRGELIRPEEVASAVGWLCSPAAAAVNGVAIPVAGGEVA